LPVAQWKLVLVNFLLSIYGKIDGDIRAISD
jgi:hypothetical protein